MASTGLPPSRGASEALVSDPEVLEDGGLLFSLARFKDQRFSCKATCGADYFQMRMKVVGANAACAKAVVPLKVL